MPELPRRGRAPARATDILAVDGKRYPSLDSEARLGTVHRRVASHKCAGKQVDGCRAATPVELTSRARRPASRPSRCGPSTTRRPGALGSASATAATPRRLGVGGAAGRAGDTIVARHQQAPVTVFANLFEAEQRKEVSGVVGVSDVANQTIDIGSDASR